MVSDKELDHIVDAIGHKSATRLLFLSRRIPALGSSCKDLQSCGARLCNVMRPYAPIVYLRRHDPAPPTR
jgi:hypothetical protein